jgi:hypothetical protein
LAATLVYDIAGIYYGWSVTIGARAGEAALLVAMAAHLGLTLYVCLRPEKAAWAAWTNGLLLVGQVVATAGLLLGWVRLGPGQRGGSPSMIQGASILALAAISVAVWAARRLRHPAPSASR